MKIDIFSHIIPKKYKDAVLKKTNLGISTLEGWTEQKRALSDINVRLRLMERHPDVMQVIVPALAPLEVLVSPSDAYDLARLYNDEAAELTEKYPDKFLAAVALLPLNDIDASQKEVERAIMKLKIRGVLMHSTINGDPIDLPKFRPIFAQMAEFDLPIYIHPSPSYLPINQLPLAKEMSEHHQANFKRLIIGALQGPVDTSLAMIRLAVSGIFREYPKIKILTHHCGGVVPFCFDRINQSIRDDPMHKFYGDTALLDAVGPLMCGYLFFGPDRLLFGTDTPQGRAHSYGVIRETIQVIEQLDIPAIDKEKIFERNALNLLRVGL